AKAHDRASSYSRKRAGRTRSQPNLSALFRQSRAIAAPFRTTSSMQRANSRGSDVARKPFRPGVMRSGRRPVEVATRGVPHANDSKQVMGIASRLEVKRVALTAE